MIQKIFPSQKKTQRLIQLQLNAITGTKELRKMAKLKYNATNFLRTEIKTFLNIMAATAEHQETKSKSAAPEEEV